ncbi:MAG TPA: S46 family peptidase [Pyrinomonadaceae bacterium]|nr:S46 family peptidase [Pyrinomonadaceae bacterium]
MSSGFARASAFLLATLLLVSLAFLPAFGDEGLFLPDAISSLPMERLAQRGLKLKASDIYTPAGGGLTDAVVILPGGTGEFVSAEGLLLTNHHIAFDALVAASTPQHDYGTNGYVARSRSEEMPAQDFTVQILQGMSDVTSEVTSAVKGEMSSEDRNRIIEQKIHRMEFEAANGHQAEGITAQVIPMNEGLSYYRFTYQVLRDVRVVYAPPKSIGFFGGDPDNFEWPRHCGDFTFLRAYVGPDGKPADYSPQNVPYKPKKFLSISMNGVREGDFVFALGYPGTTTRYRESYSVVYNQDIYEPFVVELFSSQVEALEEIGRNDSAQRVKLQAKIFDLTNTIKDYEGSILALRRSNLAEQKRQQEAAFTRWVNENPVRAAKYGQVLPNLAQAYQDYQATALRDLIVTQIWEASDLFTIADFAQRVSQARESPTRNPNLDQIVQRVRAQSVAALQQRNPVVERTVLTLLFRKAAELPAGQKIAALENRFGNLQSDARRRAEAEFARQLVESSRLPSAESATHLLDMTSAQLRDMHEPLLDFTSEFSSENDQAEERTERFNNTLARWRPLLIEGMSEMRNVKFYPDGNRTLRFTYGEVRGYVPREAIVYQPFTTLSGVIEKDTGREPFDVPERLKQLYKAHDFGPYALPDRADVPVDFLSTLDIIGGNSGSPIMNGRGEQVGIVFDGNYEGLGNEFFYNEAKQRAISVDIRYVLFLVDKFGGAGYILRELDIHDMPARRAAA